MKSLPKEFYPTINEMGYVRVAAAVPPVHVGDVLKNVEEHIRLTDLAVKQGVRVICFPECSLTGYTCMDDFLKPALQNAALDGLNEFCSSIDRSIVAIVGLPLKTSSGLYNCAAVICNNEVVAFIPKSFLANYGEFQEDRWFKSGLNLLPGEMISFIGNDVPFGVDIIVDCQSDGLESEGVRLGVEICEDLWSPIPPGSMSAVAGAQVIFNLSASNETVTKADWRRGLVTHKIGDNIVGYVYVSCGQTESTSSVVFGGHCLVSECGNLIAERKPLVKEDDEFFELLVTDIDLMKIEYERGRNCTWSNCAAMVKQQRKYRLVEGIFSCNGQCTDLRRQIDPLPFVPNDPAKLVQRCHETLDIQVAGLMKRLLTLERATGKREITLGLSGGRDSILSLLVAVLTYKRLDWDMKGIIVFTMPGFGTTKATYDVACNLARALGTTFRVVSIVDLSQKMLSAMGHELPCQIDGCLICQNTQARLRTDILMNLGFMLGTGNMTEGYQGYSTYGGDHLSMYNPNCSVPKTLVNFLLKVIADTEMLGDEVSQIINSALNIMMSAELIRPKVDGVIDQITEEKIGSIKLLDFIMFNDLRNGFPPDKIFYLACRAFDEVIEPEEILKRLESSFKNFYANQFKRNAVPDGAKTGSVCIDPRGDLRRSADLQLPIIYQNIFDGIGEGLKCIGNILLSEMQKK